MPSRPGLVNANSCTPSVLSVDAFPRSGVSQNHARVEWVLAAQNRRSVVLQARPMCSGDARELP
ncbi:MAG TPA: hypothetical protein VFP09_01830, partial [Desertimonas sp.]|nr:hypothetical protein [Desertimonas sp.]